MCTILSSPIPIIDIINESQIYGSTYELIRITGLSTKYISSILSQRDPTVNDIITYLHCIMLDNTTPKLSGEYNYIYDIYHHGIIYNHPIYSLLSGKIIPNTLSEMDLVVKARVRKVDNFEIMIKNDWIDNIVGHKRIIRKRINDIINTKYYWNLVGKRIYAKWIRDITGIYHPFS